MKAAPFRPSPEPRFAAPGRRRCSPGAGIRGIVAALVACVALLAPRAATAQSPSSRSTQLAQLPLTVDLPPGWTHRVVMVEFDPVPLPYDHLDNGDLHVTLERTPRVTCLQGLTRDLRTSALVAARRFVPSPYEAIARAARGAPATYRACANLDGDAVEITASVKDTLPPPDSPRLVPLTRLLEAIARAARFRPPAFEDGDAALVSLRTVRLRESNLEVRLPPGWSYVSTVDVLKVVTGQGKELHLNVYGPLLTSPEAELRTGMTTGPMNQVSPPPWLPPGYLTLAGERQDDLGALPRCHETNTCGAGRATTTFLFTRAGPFRVAVVHHQGGRLDELAPELQPMLASIANAAANAAPPAPRPTESERCAGYYPPPDCPAFKPLPYYPAPGSPPPGQAPPPPAVAPPRLPALSEAGLRHDASGYGAARLGVVAYGIAPDADLEKRGGAMLDLDAFAIGLPKMPLGARFAAQLGLQGGPIVPLDLRLGLGPSLELGSSLVFMLTLTGGYDRVGWSDEASGAFYGGGELLGRVEFGKDVAAELDFLGVKRNEDESPLAPSSELRLRGTVFLGPLGVGLDYANYLVAQRYGGVLVYGF